MTDATFLSTTEDSRTYSSFELFQSIRYIPLLMGSLLDNCTMQFSGVLNYNLWYLDFICQKIENYGQVKSLNGGTFINTGSNVDVYVLDSGINYNHSEFESRAQVLTNYLDPYSSSQGVVSGKDVTGGGTAFASLIGGKRLGVLKGCNLYSVKIFDENGNWNQDNLDLAVNSVISHHQTKLTGYASIAFVGLMEVPTPDTLRIPANTTSDLMQVSVKKLYDSGIPCIVPAGDGFIDTDGTVHSRLNAEVVRPARMEEVITVSALSIYSFPFNYSSYGQKVDLWSPGSSVPVAKHDHDDYYNHAQGTKVAASLVTGIAGSYLSKNPSATPEEVKCFITKHAYRDLVSGFDFVYISDEILSSTTSLIDTRILIEHPWGVELVDYPYVPGYELIDKVAQEFFVHTNLYWVTDEDLGTVAGNTCFSVKLEAISNNLYEQKRNVKFHYISGTNDDWLSFNDNLGTFSGLAPDTTSNINVEIIVRVDDGVFLETRTFVLVITPTPSQTILEGFLHHYRGDVIVLNFKEYQSQASLNFDEVLGDKIKHVRQPAHKLVRVYNHTTNELVFETKSDISTGRFEVSLASGTYYIIAQDFKIIPYQQNARVVDKITI